MDTRRVDAVLGEAKRLARAAHAEMVTSEALALALLFDNWAAYVIKRAGFSTEKFMSILRERLIPGTLYFTSDEDLSLSLAVQRALDYAWSEARENKTGEVEPLDLLVSLLREQDSFVREEFFNLGGDVHALKGMIRGAREPGMRVKYSILRKRLEAISADLPRASVARMSLEEVTALMEATITTKLSAAEMKQVQAMVRERVKAEQNKAQRSVRARSSSASKPKNQPEPQDGAEEPKRLTQDMLEQARNAELERLIGREAELARLLTTLLKHKISNVILVGDAGVGKTTIVHGLAMNIAAGEVPKELRGVNMVSVDMSAMVAGTQYRGSFEERLLELSGEIEKLDRPIIVLDTVQQIFNSGKSSSADASEHFRRLLSSGKVRCVGTASYSDLKRLEQDEGLYSLFEIIDIAEPSRDEALEVVREVIPDYEHHHGQKFTDEALTAAVDLSITHVPQQRLPFKALNVLDTAAAAVNLSGRRKRLVEIGDVQDVVAKFARIPTIDVEDDERKRLAHLKSDLYATVFGQDSAIEEVTTAVIRSRAGLRRPNKPVGSFLFTGPTGVGKTELAKQLAATLGVPLIRYDMSEFSERQSAAKFIGSAPGYVGHEQGGHLIESILKSPNSVLLLDEIEKAASEIYDLLLQIMDNAALTDSRGRRADFQNVILIMTSNVGAHALGTQGIGFGAGMNEGAADKIYEQTFKPEFRNRLDARVKFNALGPEQMGQIVSKFIDELALMLASKDVTLRVSDAAMAELARAGFDPLMGARPLSRLIQTQLSDRLGEELIFGAFSERGGTARVDYDADKGDFTFRFRRKPRPKAAKSADADKAADSDK